MRLSLKLKTPTKEIERMILDELCDALNKNLVFVGSLVQNHLAYYVNNKIKESEEYDSLVNGKLKAEFGLEDAQNRVDTIIRQWVNSFEIKFRDIKPKVRTITGGFTINAIRSDFEDVTQLAEATVLSKSGEVPWLQWLLLEGYSVLVADYEIRFGNYPQSRTGEAIMYRATGKSYRVPPEFAGLKDSNWITRVFDGVDAEIEAIMTKEVKRLL